MESSERSSGGGFESSGILVLEFGGRLELPGSWPPPWRWTPKTRHSDAVGVLEREIRQAAATTRATVAVAVCKPPASARVQTAVKALHNLQPPLPVLALIAASKPDEVLEFVELGVDDFAVAPFSGVELVPRLWKLAERAGALDPGDPSASDCDGIEGLIGRSQPFQDLVRQVRVLARCDATVLIEGATGSGKELCARAIHKLSARKERPFCAVNCGALPGELVENELFGHRRAAFTSASIDQVGLVTEAEGGTIFLDEIDCLPPSGQAALLRFVEDREYRPLGSTRIRRADVRILAASNTELTRAVADGKFRGDLYYRLDLLRLSVPSLWERREDIPILANHFLLVYSRRFGNECKRLDPEAMSVLLEYEWPGNVRELEHTIGRAVADGVGSAVLTRDHLGISGQSGRAEALAFREAKQRMVEEFERSYVCTSLAVCGGNIARAARAAGKNRRAFWELMRRYGIEAGSFKMTGAPVVGRS